MLLINYTTLRIWCDVHVAIDDLFYSLEVVLIVLIWFLLILIYSTHPSVSVSIPSHHKQDKTIWISEINKSGSCRSTCQGTEHQSTLFIVYICWGAGMAQWWEHSLPTNVSLVWLLDPVSYVGWVCCWFSSLLPEVFLRVLRFFPLLKNQHFQIPIQSGIVKHFIMSLWLGWLRKHSLCLTLNLHLHFYIFFTFTLHADRFLVAS